MSGRLRDRLLKGLAEPATGPAIAGDLPELRDGAEIPAAVLVAITDRADPGLILTVRRDDMRTHPGQVAFPGGRIDAGEDPTGAALREAHEELGLDPSNAEVITALDPYRTVTGFIVTPVIACIPPDLPLSPHEREVADWFEAPLAYVLDPSNHRHESAVFAGRERRYWQIEWEGRKIWGATAAMLVNLSRRVRWS